MTVIDFLLARIAEDEAVAQAAREHEYLSAARDASPLRWVKDPLGYGTIWVNSGRVLAECGVKRETVAQCQALINSFGDWDAEPGAPVMWTDVNRRERSQAHGRLHLLASVYADHPDYREEWS